MTDEDKYTWGNFGRDLKEVAVGIKKDMVGAGKGVRNHVGRNIKPYLYGTLSAAVLAAGGYGAYRNSDAIGRKWEDISGETREGYEEVLEENDWLRNLAHTRAVQKDNVSAVYDSLEKALADSNEAFITNEYTIGGLNAKLDSVYLVNRQLLGTWNQNESLIDSLGDNE